MVKISQIGVGQKSSGTLDGITYVTRKGVTFARTAPKMPARMFKTSEARKRQAIFKMIQMHIKYHLHTIKATFESSDRGSVSNNYYHTNCTALTDALASLAEHYVNGEDITITDVENAICNYASEHPKSIKIACKSGKSFVYLTGAWPESITLTPSGSDSITIISVGDNGEKTVIKPDGTTTVSTGSSSNGSNNQSGSGSSSGSNNSGASGDQNPDDDNPNRPEL